MTSISTFIKSKTSLNKIQAMMFLLTLFSVIVDPTNEILKIKNLSFIIFVILSIRNRKFEKILQYVFLLFMYYITYAFQLLFPTCYLDSGAASAILKSFIYLSVIFWMGKDNKIPVFKYFFYINLGVALFCITIWALIMVNPSLELPLYAFFMRRDNFTMTISHRVFLGISVFGIFHKTCVFSVFCLAYSVYVFLFNKKKLYLLFTLIFFLYLFNSGTRANMLSSVLIIAGCYAYYQYKKKHLAFLVLLLSSGFFIFTILILLLLGDKGDQSVAIKDQHQISYWTLFYSNILRYLVIGDGPGSTFFSSGWGKIVNTTELSYYELIRNYGAFFSLIFMIIFLEPIINLYNLYGRNLFFPLLLSYLAYLFIAGTNPYLIGSTGFTAFAVMIYSGNNDINKEMKNE